VREFVDSLVRYVDPEEGCDPLHLTVEVVEKVGVVHEHDVGLIPATPCFGEVVEHAVERLELILCGCIRFDPAEEPFIERRQHFGPGEIRIAGEFGNALAVDVGALVVERHGGVERVSGDDDVRDSTVVR
jgi:hypothetical protein